MGIFLDGAWNVDQLGDFLTSNGCYYSDPINRKFSASGFDRYEPSLERMEEEWQENKKSLSIQKTDYKDNEWRVLTALRWANRTS